MRLTGNALGSRSSRAAVARLLVATVAATALCSRAAEAITRVTDYSYNPDGAVTAITTQIDDETPQTVYVTWDNFLPDTGDPTSGEVSARNGRMIAVGSAPGTTSPTESFDFDRRDRLIGYRGPKGDETIDYHANGPLASTDLGTDGLRFYHDLSANAQVVNIYQSAADVWSARLGSIRYLDDGTEEALIAPRKDVACTYAPGDETLQSYVYTAYGESRLEEIQDDTYDLAENPFRYAGEFRSSVSGAYYLRTRWYHPELKSFLSRDGQSTLNRYGYVSGNPVMRTDPTGLKFNYAKDIGNPLSRGIKALNKGVGGNFARVFLSPLLGVAQIAADPGDFWKAVKTDRDGIDIFLALGVASEAAGGFLDVGFAGYGTSVIRRFLTRSVSDVAIGVGQSTAAAAGRGFHHFDWNSFGQGLEYTAGAVLWRGVTKFNVRKARLPGGSVASFTGDLDAVPSESDLLSRSQGQQRGAIDDAKPFGKSSKLSNHHNVLLDLVNDEQLQPFTFEELQDVGMKRNNIDDTFRQNKRSIKFRNKSSLKSNVVRRRDGTVGLRSTKRIATRVSRAPGFDDIIEEEDSEDAFQNQAKVHAGFVTNELTD